jgi:hypothetical protein
VVVDVHEGGGPRVRVPRWAPLRPGGCGAFMGADRRSLPTATGLVGMSRFKPDRDRLAATLNEESMNARLTISQYPKDWAEARQTAEFRQ